MADGWASYGWEDTTPTGPVTTATSSAPPPRPLVAVLESKPVGGQMLAQLPAAPAGAVRWVRRITVSTPGYNTATRAYVYVGDAVPEAIVMGTRAGTLDYALEDPPLFIPESTPLSVQWDAGPTRALARIEYTQE